MAIMSRLQIIKFMKTLFSIRSASLFLILFGLFGTLTWPITGIYFVNSVGRTESALDSVIFELRMIEQALNESYSKLDDLEKSTSDFEVQLENIFDTLNKSSSTLSELSMDIEEASRLLVQSSESPILILLSEDFAIMLRNAAGDLNVLSEAFQSQSISFNDFLKELNEIENITRIGTQIIHFLKNIFKSFSLIVKTVELELESVSKTLVTLGNSIFVLALDAAFIHLSLVIIGLIIKSRR